MKYIGQTKLEHGIVMHYFNSCGNIESHFIENEFEDSIFIDINNKNSN